VKDSTWQQALARDLAYPASPLDLD